MKTSRFGWTFCIITLSFFLLPSAMGQHGGKQTKIPDFTAGDKIPANANHDWNLGPTGARGWIYSNRLETTQARQILITKIDKGSPADGVLAINDVILGVAGKEFSYCPRQELGRAITEAEATSGKLLLKIWRDAAKEDITIRLSKIGKYSSTAPFDCKKSERIFRQSITALAVNLNRNPGQGNRIVRALNTLALLSSGEEKFMPVVRDQIKWAASFSDVQGKSLCCWYYGPINMLLAEYILATGDKTYMADLERITMEIVRGQSDVGTWGHRFTRPDGRLNGYGMMNAPGLPMTMSLVLAQKAGVNNAELDEAIEKSLRLMRFYVGKGSVPYGDHAPWLETHDDNGKNGIAALLFNAHGDAKAAEYFSRMSVASHGHDRELGHTGNYFNMLWAMPGVALSGPNASGQWMREFGWYYDLARRWDGTFQHQGPAQPRTDSYNNWDSTGAYALAYAQPLRQLHITGKQEGLVPHIARSDADKLVNDGRGFSHRQRETIYEDKSPRELLELLSSWSPVVRQRSAEAMARREDFQINPVIRRLKSKDLDTRLGACQALAQLNEKSAPAVPALRRLLDAEDLWLRINAAKALAAIGAPARVAIPDLLNKLAKTSDDADPRGMEQRYLCSSLFDRREGLLRRSLEGVDRDALYAAVRNGLLNEDGRARGVVSSVFKNLSYEEIEPLLPAIHAAVVELAPSGMMFADGIRTAGLQILAEHKIAEGLPLCVDIMELDRWGSDKRINAGLKALQTYASAAKEVIPNLQPLKEHLEKRAKRNDKAKKQLELLNQTIAKINSNQPPPELKRLHPKAIP